MMDDRCGCGCHDGLVVPFADPMHAVWACENCQRRHVPMLPNEQYEPQQPYEPPKPWTPDTQADGGEGEEAP